MFTTTRVTCGIIPCKEYVGIPLQHVSISPARQLKVPQLSNSTNRGALTVFRSSTKKGMAVSTNYPGEAMSSEELCTVSKSMSQFKWRGGVEVVLNCELDAAWSLQADFLGLCKWVPNVSVCRLDDGEPNAVGCLRFCQGSGTTWVHERLLEFDGANHYMSYRMEDNHFVFHHGFQGYVAKVQLGDAGEGKTWVKWTYEVDPVATQTEEKLTAFMVGFYTLNLQYLETGAHKLVAGTNEAAGSPNVSASINSAEEWKSQAPTTSVQG